MAIGKRKKGIKVSKTAPKKQKVGVKKKPVKRVQIVPAGYKALLNALAKLTDDERRQFINSLTSEPSIRTIVEKDIRKIGLISKDFEHLRLKLLMFKARGKKPALPKLTGFGRSAKTTTGPRTVAEGAKPVEVKKSVERIIEDKIKQLDDDLKKRAAKMSEEDKSLEKKTKEEAEASVERLSVFGKQTMLLLDERDRKSQELLAENKKTIEELHSNIEQTLQNRIDEQLKKETDRESAAIAFQQAQKEEEKEKRLSEAELEAKKAADEAKKLAIKRTHDILESRRRQEQQNKAAKIAKKEKESADRAQRFEKQRAAMRKQIKERAVVKDLQDAEVVEKKKQKMKEYMEKKLPTIKSATEAIQLVNTDEELSDKEKAGLVALYKKRQTEVMGKFGDRIEQSISPGIQKDSEVYKQIKTEIDAIDDEESREAFQKQVSRGESYAYRNPLLTKTFDALKELGTPKIRKKTEELLKTEAGTEEVMKVLHGAAISMISHKGATGTLTVDIMKRIQDSTEKGAGTTSMRLIKALQIPGLAGRVTTEAAADMLLLKEKGMGKKAGIVLKEDALKMAEILGHSYDVEDAIGETKEEKEKALIKQKEEDREHWVRIAMKTPSLFHLSPGKAEVLHDYADVSTFLEEEEHPLPKEEIAMVGEAGPSSQPLEKGKATEVMTLAEAP